MTDSNKRTRRSPAEMLAARQADVERLQVKAALDTAKANPILAPLVKAIEENDKALVEAKKGFSTGPQSFENRIKGHNLWLDEIEAQKSLALMVQETSELIKDEGRDALAGFVKTLANGGKVTKKAVSEAVENLAQSAQDGETVKSLQDAVTAATEARKAFNTAKRKPKKALKVEKKVEKKVEEV